MQRLFLRYIIGQQDPVLLLKVWVLGGGVGIGWTTPFVGASYGGGQLGMEGFNLGPGMDLPSGA